MIKKKDIKNKKLEQIVDDYNEIKNWLVEHRKRLELLKKDHELLTCEPPYKIHFAVDFHDIYRLVFPLGSEKEIKKIKESKKEAWIHDKVVSQTGRICLFYGIETLPVPVLLPPYRDELEDFLLWLKGLYTKAYHQYQVILKLRESIQAALHEKRKGEHLEFSDKNYAKIIKFIKKYFFQLSLLLMYGYEEKLSILRSLFSDDRIEMVSVRWSEYSEFIDDEKKKVPLIWHKFIRKYRKENHPESQLKEMAVKRSNSRDLLALHLIKSLNKKFIAENKKEFVLLISNAEIFKSLLNTSTNDDTKDKTIGGVVKTATGEEITLCRTTDMFHTYLLIKKEREELKDQYKQEFSANLNTQINRVTLINVEDDLRKIKLIEEFDREIDLIINFCNKREHDCQEPDKCPKEDICYRTDKVIKKFQKDRKSFESLALADKFDIYTKIYTRYQEIVKIDGAAKQILKLLQDDKKVSEIINKKLEDIREHINSGFEKLADNSIIREPEPDVLKIPRGNSFRIKTYDKEVDEIIRKIQKSIRQNSQENFSVYFSALKNKKERLDKTKALKYLSSSLFAAAYEKYDLAIYFMETGLIFEEEKAPLYCELKYLETIIYCNKKKYEKALTLCNELVNNYQDDGRFPYFCGYIILTGKDDGDLKTFEYKDAVRYCKDALSIVKKTGDDDRDLRIYILNNLIYGLAKIGSSSSIDEADKYIVELKMCSKPEDDWGFHIWHTIGYVKYKKAELIKGKNEDYSSIKDKAIECFEIANKKAQGGIKVIEEDLKKAREL